MNPRGDSAKILVVDDMQANLRLLCDRLQRAGYQVRGAADGTEALAVAVAWQPDLILLDVLMPGIDGFEVCRRLRATAAFAAEALAAGLPVIASNVHGIPEVLAGTESVMVPPDDPNALRKAVLETLHRSPAEAAKAVESGRNRAEQFRIGERIDSMIRLFEDVLAGRF